MQFQRIPCLPLLPQPDVVSSMDSVSQMALGACVCYAAVGPTIGRRALLIGAAVGTLPDLDVLVPYEDAVASFTYHRSWSHSLFVLSLVSLPLAWLLQRVTRAMASVSFRRWWLAVWLVLITHILLDSFTIYGTQIFWPLPAPPVAIGSIFIIDPLYTIPLLVSIAITWRRNPDTTRAVMTALVMSTVYLGWTLASQALTTQRLKQQVAAQGVNANTTVIAPFPSALLWRIVLVNDDHYFEAFSSMLDNTDEPLQLTRFNHSRRACEQQIVTVDRWAIDRMDWFTNGAIAVARRDDRLVITDLRMGMSDDYVFEFDVGGFADTSNETTSGVGGAFEPAISVQLPIDIDATRLSTLIKRVTDPTVMISASADTASATESLCRS